MTGFQRFEDGPQAEMPRYRSHKIVHALKIKAMTRASSERKDGQETGQDGWMIMPEESGFAAFYCDTETVAKHNPNVGWYYIVYPDGYRSFSPPDAFESGYTRLP